MVSLVTSALLIFADGHVFAAMPALGLALWLGKPQCRSPTALRWASGQWQLQLPGAGWTPVEILASVHSLSWLLAFRWRRAVPGGDMLAGTTLRPRWLYLWPDSLEPEQWRRVRKCLRLQG